MAILPGWNSLESTSEIAHWLHVSAIVVLALLVVAEGLALVYDGRKDTLTVAIESAAAAQREQAQQANDAEHKAEITRLQAITSHRKMIPEQQARVANKMSKWAILPNTTARQSVAVFSATGAFESTALADQIAFALGLGQAGWNINRHPVTYGMSFSVSGVGLLTSSNPRGLEVAAELAKALNDEGVATFLIPQHRPGWEGVTGEAKDKAAADPFWSQISVIVGDHPQ